MPVAKEQIRQIISENNLSSVTDVYALLRDSFKDILQELMEAELDATLGYEKNRKGDLQTDITRLKRGGKTAGTELRQIATRAVHGSHNEQYDSNNVNFSNT